MNEDLSSLFEKLNINKNNVSPEMINNLMNMLNKNNNNNSNNKSTGDSSNLDFETIMKMKNIIDKMNVKDDPRSNLLASLKPYLKKSRRDKLDQYIQLMNLSRVIDVFPYLGGDKKNAHK